MFSLLSIIIGLLGLALGVVAFFPLLGWARWAIVPVAIVGLILAFIGGSSTGKTINLLVIVVGIGRLAIGGGVI